MTTVTRFSSRSDQSDLTTIEIVIKCLEAVVGSVFMWVNRLLAQGGLLPQDGSWWLTRHLIFNFLTIAVFFSGYVWMLKSWSVFSRLCVAVIAFVCWVEVFW